MLLNAQNIIVNHLTRSDLFIILCPSVGKGVDFCREATSIDYLSVRQYVRMSDIMTIGSLSAQVLVCKILSQR